MASGMTTLSPVFGRTPALIRLKRIVVKPNATSPSGAGLASFCALSAMFSSPSATNVILIPRIAAADDSTVRGSGKRGGPLPQREGLKKNGPGVSPAHCNVEFETYARLDGP